MVGVLVDRLGKLYAKLDNRHHVRPEGFSASLEAFRSEVSVSLNDLMLFSKPGSDFISFPWIFSCFQLLPQINDAFGKMVVEIDHPVTKWGASVAGSYLDYGFRLLGFLNSITYSVSHLGRARLSLSYALCLWEKKSFPLAIKHLRPVELSDPINKTSGFSATAQEEGEEETKQRFACEKDKIVHEALMDLKGIAFWVCSIISAVLAGNPDLKLEKGSSVSGFSSSSLVELDSRISVAISKKNGSLEVVKELNDAVASLASGERSEAAVKELVKKLEGLEIVLESLRRGVDHLFSKLLAARNELLQGIRLTNK